MFVVLIGIMTLISISLKLLASSTDLAKKVIDRKSGYNKSSSNKVLNDTVKVGLTVSSKSLRLVSFIVSWVRNTLIASGSLYIVLELLIFLIVVICSNAYLTLFN